MALFALCVGPGISQSYSQAPIDRSGPGTAARPPDLAVAYLLDAIKAQQAGRPAQAIRSYEQALKIRPDFLPAHYNLSQLYLQAGRTAEAVRELKIVAGKAGAGDTHLQAAADFRLGQIEAQQGHTASALSLFKLSLKLDPQNADALAELGALAGKQGDYPAAARYLRQYVGLRPDNGLAWFNLGILFGRLNQFPEAVHAFQTAAHSPALPVQRRVEALTNAGRVLDRIGHSERAAASYSQAIHLDPGFVPALEGRALDEQKIGQFDAALADYNKLLKSHADNALALFNSGVILVSQRQYAQASARFERVLKLVPGNNLARSDLAYAEATQAGDSHLSPAVRRDLLTKARDLYQEAETRDPKNPNNYAGLAFVYEQTNDLKSAVDQYERLIALDPGKTEVLDRLASLDSRLHDWPKAIEHAHASAALQPNESSAWIALSGYQLASGNAKDAASTLRTYLARHPDDTAVQLRLAAVTSSTGGSSPEAEEAFRTILKRDPKNIQALQGLAELVKTHDPSEAARLLSTALPQETGTNWLMTGRELADLYIQLHQPQQVIQVYETMLQTAGRVTDPEDRKVMSTYVPFIRGLLAQAYLGQKDFAGALKVYQAEQAANPSDPNAVLGEARVFELEGKPDLALQQYTEAVRLQPANLGALTGYLHLGAQLHSVEWIRTESIRLLDSQLLQPDSGPAMQAFRAAATGEQGLPFTRGVLEAIAKDHPESPEAQVALASFYTSTGEWQRGVDLYTSLLQKTPNSARYHQERGQMEEQHGQESAALTDYRDAVRLAPDDVTYQRSVLRLLERQTGTDNERIAILTHILELEPASTAEAMRLSNLYTGPDADHQRVVMFRGLIQRAPNVVTYHDALASALAAIGDTDGAQSEYNTALKLNPQDATARTGLQKLGASAPAPPAGTLTPP